MGNKAELDIVELELYAKTYQNEDKFCNLLDELTEKYGELSSITISRCKLNKKAKITFKVKRKQL